MWPDLLAGGEDPEQDDDSHSSDAKEEQALQAEEIEVTFKNLRWTRVVALSDHEEGQTQAHDLSEDILASLKEMEDIELSPTACLITHFDPIKWQEDNPT